MNRSEMAAEVQSCLSDLEPLILARLNASGLPMLFTLHVVVNGGPGSSSTNIPPEYMLEFAKHNYDQTLKAMALKDRAN